MIVWIRRIAWVVGMFFFLGVVVQAFDAFLNPFETELLRPAIVVWSGLALVVSIVRGFIDRPAYEVPGWIARMNSALAANSTAIRRAIGAVILTFGALAWIRFPPASTTDGIDPALAVYRPYGATGILALVGAALSYMVGTFLVSIFLKSRKANTDDAPRLEFQAPNTLAHHLPWIGFAGSALLVVGSYFASLNLSDALIQVYTQSLWLAILYTIWIPRADVGADGVYIWGLNRRFVQFTGREIVRTRWWGLEILRDGHRILRMRVIGERDLAQRQHLVDRVRAALATARAKQAASAEVIARNAVLGATGGELDYRSAPLTRDDLWRIVETPTTEPRVRIDAAKRIADDRQADDDARLLLVADTCADPETREAIAALVPISEPENAS